MTGRNITDLVVKSERAAVKRQIQEVASKPQSEQYFEAPIVHKDGHIVWLKVTVAPYHAYKSLGIGTLVGKPTFGAVISTGGTGLLNGSFLRLPFRAWYVKDSGMNMENGPAVPDVVLDNAPASRAKGEDAQLQKAVEILLEQINNSNK